MRRAIIAISVVLSLGIVPAAADDAVVRPEQPQWTEPSASVTADPAAIVEDLPRSSATTVVYAVQDGDGLRIETQQAPSVQAAEETIAEVQAQPDVLAVDVDVPRRLTSLPAQPVATDPQRADQWALDMLQAETAWDYSVGSGVTVAVLDSGISRHQDLGGDFVKGIDLVSGSDGRDDNNGHGTHVTGIIAMTANNAEGGAGLAHGVTIMPVTVADPSGWVRAADSARGIVWAVDHGADVLNMSYSGAASTVEQKAIQYAVANDVIPVAAVGNAYLDSAGGLYNPVQYPAAYPGVIGVGAVTRGLLRSSFSEVGKQVDIMAPGGSGMFDSPKGIFSTFSDGRYVRMPGTSMATPYVSATMALTIARERGLGLNLNAADVVLGTTTDLGIPGRDDEFGFGLVNPTSALQLVTSVVTTGTQPPTVRPSEVQTRLVRQVQVQSRPGIVRFRVPASGQFVIAIQRVKNQKWSEPIRMRGLYKGRTWHSVAVPRGLKIRVLAGRDGAIGKDDPVWVSPTTRTRARR